MSAACPKYLFKMADPSFLAPFWLRLGGFGIANLNMENVSPLHKL